MHEESRAKRDDMQQKRKILSSPIGANSVNNAASPINLKQSCWDAIFPQPLRVFTAVRKVLLNQREEWAATQTFQVETGLWRWNVVYLPAYRNKTATGRFSTLK